MQTTITKWGNSQGVRLPKPLLESAHLLEDDIVEVIVKDDSIIIKKTENKRRHRTLKERLAGFDGEYIGQEWDTGPSVGNEVF